MPIYEYHCRECKADVEVLLLSRDESPECPGCGSKQLNKLLSVTAAPSTNGSLPVASAEPQTCGRSQCQSGCMYD